ncbi:MAG: ornithine carbamoyltransferase [Sphaerochaetaceae bacterium]|nr:ornithine carbamoyltransferase [Sphaerochaetaceae bacterium]MDD4007548.1 ornithine carbamoyltransferase [Sphaerochaetaceae bacterium]MDD4397085.1 ornithine carbamoyltransferase [Sphaerochaetaceae bacterium]
MDLSGRSLIKLLDFTPEEIRYLLDVSKELKEDKKLKKSHRYLEGKNLVLLFEKTSTRTRCAFEVAGMDLGMGVTFLDSASSQMGKKESLADTARVLGRMYDGIEYRGYKQQTVVDLARYSKVPVFNGLTDQFHPTQILADLLTVEENFGRLNGINFTYMGDARFNMGNSLMVGCAKMGLNFTACAPADLFPDPALVAECQEVAAKSGGTITLTDDVEKGTRNADVLYTDIWVSMGEPDSVWSQRIKDLSPYQVNRKAMANANPNAIFMHCLPSFHDTNTTVGQDICSKYGISEMEVSDEVFESPQSVVFDEAENRMHTIKAVILAMLRNFNK